MKLEFPLIDRSLRGGRLLRWNKQEGDRIEFGDVVCHVELDDFAALRRTARANLLAGRKRRSLKDEVEAREGKVAITVALTASDAGQIQNIRAPEGTEVSVGSLLAVVSSEGTTDTTEQPVDEEDLPAMRVTGNVVDPDDLEALKEGMG